MTDAPDPRLGVDTAAMDPSVPPGDDFFRFVNGKWLDSAEIPEDKARFGVFDQLRDRSEEAVQAIIRDLDAGGPPPGTDERRIADIYKSFMDTATVAAKGLDPVRGDLAAIDAIEDGAGLARAFARAGFGLGGAPFGLYVGQDAKAPDEYRVHLYQSGLGLPDRDYYFRDDPKTEEIRKKYREFLMRLFTLAGEPDPAGAVEAVYALETKLAGGQWTRVANRDRDKTYNKLTVGELARRAPGIDWAEYLQAARVRPEEEAVIAAQPDYLEKCAELVRSEELGAWRLYLKARTLSAAAPYLTDDFVEARFDYAGRALSGQPEIRARWKRAVALVDGAVGELVGKTYVREHFPESSKRRMLALVENLRAAYAERIAGLDWMGEETKARALEKLKKFRPKIGYPDKWKDYSKLATAPDDLVGNVKRAGEVEYDRMVEKLGKPIDREEWGMNPQTVNAYYNSSLNEIVFPAAILQPPFFNAAADDAVNYGAIGGVIGHEMGHGFDDQGSKSDGNGLMRDWWTPKDKEDFTRRTGKLVGQYSAFEPVPGGRVNGQLTLGENIGDLGGLTVAFRAYELSLGGRTPAAIGGFTGRQRVFLGWGQVWRAKERETSMRQRLNTDPHSPPEYRVNGVVRNMPEFYAAFGVKETDKLYLKKEDRVAIW